jgi:hypothetical protein
VPREGRGRAVGVVLDGRADRGRASELLQGRAGRLAEARRQRQLPGGVERLAAQAQHLVLGEQRAQLADGGRGERLAQVEAVDLGADRRRERADVEPGAHRGPICIGPAWASRGAGRIGRTARRARRSARIRGRPAGERWPFG